MRPLGRQLIAEFIYCSAGILNDRAALEQAMTECIRESGLTLVSISGKQFDPVGVTSVAVISESHIAIHTYPEAGHASIDIFTCASGSKNVNRLLRSLKKKLMPKAVRVMEVQRGNPLEVHQEACITSFSSTGIEVKYHIEETILSKRTDYQEMDIIVNPSFGRMLFLDKDLQIAEKDCDLYNRSMISPLLDRTGTLGRVAILGGGDGGVLSAVLDCDIDSVCLVEIDKEVIEASQHYLGGVCRNAFDHKDATVVIDDANRFLEAGHTFDTIIYDLTMHPESITNMERTQFLDGIFSRIKKCLSSRGLVSMQCCSELDTETLGLLHDLLPRHFKNIVYETTNIPSFCENWVFASAEVN